MFKKRKELERVVATLSQRVKDLEQADIARTAASQFIMRRLEGEVDKIVQILIAANVLEDSNPERTTSTYFNGKQYKVKGNE